MREIVQNFGVFHAKIHKISIVLALEFTIFAGKKHIMKISVKNIEKRTKIYSIAVTSFFAVSLLSLVIGIFNAIADGNDTATIVLFSIGGSLLPLAALGVVLVDIQSLLLNLNNGKELYFADKEKE